MAQNNKGFNVDNITAFVKEAVEKLMGGYEGTFFYKLRTDGFGRTWAIVIGWNGGYEAKDDPNEYCDKQKPEYHICSKTAYNNSAMQCDYDWDWLQPYGKDGDVDDDDSALPRCNTEKDWRKLALMLKRACYRKVRDWEHTANVG